MRTDSNDVIARPGVREATAQRALRIRRQLEIADHAHSPNQDLEALARVVSHDLQGPLWAISDFWRSCEEQGQEMLNSDAKALLDIAVDAAAEAERLVTNLLEDSRAEGPPDLIGVAERTPAGSHNPGDLPQESGSTKPP